MRTGRVTLGGLNILAYSHRSSQHLGYFAIKFARDLFYYISVSADERDDGGQCGRASTYALYFPADTAHASCTHFIGRIGRIGRISLH